MDIILQTILETYFSCCVILLVHFLTKFVPEGTTLFHNLKMLKTLMIPLSSIPAILVLSHIPLSIFLIMFVSVFGIWFWQTVKNSKNLPEAWMPAYNAFQISIGVAYAIIAVNIGLLLPYSQQM